MLSKSCIEDVAIYMGERKGHDAVFENRVEQAVREIGQYLARRGVKIHYGCGHSGHAETFRQAVAGGGGQGLINDVCPDFFISRESRLGLLEKINTMADFSDAAQYSTAHQRNISAMLNIEAVLKFKNSFLMPGGVKCVFPGYNGTNSELSISLEENDTAARLELDDVPLKPIIVMNIPWGDGSGGYYDPYIEQLEKPIQKGRAHPNRRNLARFASNASGFIALFEAYERLGPVSAKDIEKFIPVVDGQPLTEFRVEPGVYSPKYRTTLTTVYQFQEGQLPIHPGWA